MSCYTVSKCILENITKTHLTDVLFPFTQGTNPFKVVLDKSNKIIELYASIGEQNELVATWIHIMSMAPTNFEKIDVEVNDVKNDEEIFLKVCAATKNQQKMFVYSHQGWKHYTYTTANIINYNSISIQIFDRDEAVYELNPRISTTINANNAIVATDGSTIQHTNNTTKGK